MEEQISNPASERVVLSGIMKHGSEAFIDVDDIIETKDFTLEQNQIVYACIKKTLENSSTIDLPSLLSAAEDLGMTESFKDRVPPDHIQGLMNCDVQLENVRTHAIKLKKLTIARDVRLRARRVISDINNVTGDETIDKIISVGETPFFELSSALNNSVEDRPVSLGDDIEGYIAHIEDNPCEMLGISSGFQRFDTAIGGYVIGAGDIGGGRDLGRCVCQTRKICLRQRLATCGRIALGITRRHNAETASGGKNSNKLKAANLGHDTPFLLLNFDKNR